MTLVPFEYPQRVARDRAPAVETGVLTADDCFSPQLAYADGRLAVGDEGAETMPLDVP